MYRCTSRIFTTSSNDCRLHRLSQGCWQTRPVEAGSGLSISTDSNASSRRPSWNNSRKRGMFIRSGQLSRKEIRQAPGTASPAPSCQDMVLVFVAEVPEGCQDRIRGRLPETAYREHARIMRASSSSVSRCLFRPTPIGDRIENPQCLIEPDSAGHALSARFRVSEFNEVSRYIHHAIVFIHHHHSARTHDRANLRQAFVIDWRVNISAGMQPPDGPPVWTASTRRPLAAPSPMS